MSITGIGHRVPGLQPLCAVSATMPNSPLRPCLETSCPVLVRGCGRCDQHKHLAPSRFANAQRGTAAATGDRSALAQRGARRAARVAAGVGTEDGCTDATRWPEGAGPKIGPRVRWTATAYRSWRLSEDLDARVTLATVRRYTCPTATWDDIAPFIRVLRAALGGDR